jgi:hypothetical protein
MATQVPIDFIKDYEKSAHYKIGDKVVDIEVGIHRIGYSFMNLVIDRQGVLYKLPFYFNQMPYEHDEDYPSEAEEIELDVDAWIESMAGATVWTDWYDNVELEAH